MGDEPPLAKAFVLIAERFGRIFVAPLPKRLLEIGSPTEGWGVRLNPTSEAVDGIQPYRAHVTFNGWPAGIMQPYGGTMMAGDHDGKSTEDALIEWLQSDMGATPACETD